MVVWGFPCESRSSSGIFLNEGATMITQQDIEKSEEAKKIINDFINNLSLISEKTKRIESESTNVDDSKSFSYKIIK